MDIDGGNRAPCTQIIMWPEKESNNENQLWDVVPECEMDAYIAGNKFRGTILSNIF